MQPPLSESVGVFPPMCPTTGVSTGGVSGTVSPWPGILRDNTLVSFAALGEEAVGRDSLFIANESSDPSEEEDISMLDLAGLQVHVWHIKKR